MSQHHDLCLLAGFAGVLMLVGTFFLLFKRIVVLDAETKAPIEFEFPVVGKLKTQAPVLFLMMLGVGLICFSILKDAIGKVYLTGQIDANGQPVEVLIVGRPYYTLSMNATQGVNFLNQPIPDIPDMMTYDVKILVDQRDYGDFNVSKLNDGLTFGPVHINPPPRAARAPLPSLAGG